jgi:hypothetical protein
MKTFTRNSLVLFPLLFLVLQLPQALGQGRQLEFSQQFRQAERIIRIAEPGQLSDTLNVWGDVNSPGRYLIPRNTTLPELISYSFGPATIRSREADLDWSKLRLEVKVSRYNDQENDVDVTTFKYRYDQPEPAAMFEYDLQNDDIVTLQVKRRPSFIDYVRVIAPVISATAAGILVIERLR